MVWVIDSRLVATEYINKVLLGDPLGGLVVFLDRGVLFAIAHEWICVVYNNNSLNND